MNFKKIAVLFCLAVSSSAMPQVQVEVIQYNDLVLTNNFVLVSTKETQSLIVENIRIEVTLNELNELIFDLAQKDEKGDFVSFYRAPSLPVQDGDEVGFGSTSGLTLVVKVSEIK